jgi:hypothetical protein
MPETGMRGGANGNGRRDRSGSLCCRFVRTAEPARCSAVEICGSILKGLCKFDLPNP